MKVEIKREMEPIHYAVRGDTTWYGQLALREGKFHLYASGYVPVPLDVLREIVKFADEQGLL